jgi:glycosyltransferase involved in cell wall biosynthesis
MTERSAERDPGSGPAVSVIVPARNEEAGLGPCLESLLAQAAVDHEIIVVDDGSTDRTREIAQSFPGVRLTAAPPLPAGCSGKCNAAQHGAKLAHAPWLLFTDADTVHRPGSLVRALAEAQKHGAALLSYSPRQEVRGFWERAVMPLVFSDLAAVYQPKQVCDPSSPLAAANGQYLLITREAYQAVGGHAAVGHTLLEDVALALAVKRSGRRIRFRYGGDAVSTRMYRNFAQLCEGWTKNLALLFPATLGLAARRAVEFALMTGGLTALAAGLVIHQPWLALAGAVVAGPT